VRLDRLQRLVTPPASHGPATSDIIDLTIRYVDGVRALGRPIVDQGCLTRGLTLYYFLRRAGLDVVLCFGIDYENGALAGHCWLVRDGEPFLEPGTPPHRYTEIYRFPSGRAGGPKRQGAPTGCLPG
jgi:Transglutaminase-like superfamily